MINIKNNNKETTIPIKSVKEKKQMRYWFKENCKCVNV